MKKSSTLLSGIIVYAFLFFISLHNAIAQPGDAAKKSQFVWADEGIYRTQLKKDGIPAATIEKLVEEHKVLLEQGRKSFFTHLIKILLQLSFLRSLHLTQIR